MGGKSSKDCTSKNMAACGVTTKDEASEQVTGMSFDCDSDYASTCSPGSPTRDEHPSISSFEACTPPTTTTTAAAVEELPRTNLFHGPDLMLLVDCHQPLMHEIAELLAESPRDFVPFFGLASHSVATQSNFRGHPAWQQMYSSWWPAFYECLKYYKNKNWKHAFLEAHSGSFSCIVDVFDREKKLGFAMAAMAARVSYQAHGDHYETRYISASVVPLEAIPRSEGHRLRFCPASAQSLLGPPICALDHPLNLEFYPYKVFEGYSALVVGKGVELQWKMQRRSPFGWWYGRLERLERDQDGRTAVASICFEHFPVGSRWYRLQVRFGDSSIRDCSFGGYTGGIRPVTDVEHKRWMCYFPREPVVF